MVGDRQRVGADIYGFLRTAGPSLSPFNVWVFLKGLETLHLWMQTYGGFATGAVVENASGGGASLLSWSALVPSARTVETATRCLVSHRGYPAAFNHSQSWATPSPLSLIQRLLLKAG